jgi:uncharacterized protein YdaU (DUF1376 family)
MDWYRRWLGDYRRDTAQLTVTEHGVYALLLDEQYATEDGLPAELRTVYKLVRAMTKNEKKTCRNVVEQYFPIAADGKRWNNRAAHEIEKYKALKNQAVESGRRGAEKRWSMGSPIAERIANPIENDRLAHQKPMQNRIALQNPEKIKNSVPPESLLPGTQSRASASAPRRVSEIIPRKPRERAKPADEELREKVKLLSAEGLGAGDIARMLRQFNVSAEQVQQWLSV